MDFKNVLQMKKKTKSFQGSTSVIVNKVSIHPNAVFG